MILAADTLGTIVATVAAFLVLTLALVALLLVVKQKLSPSGPVKITINGEKEIEVASGGSLLTTLGSEKILHQYKTFENNPRFRLFPSIRFEYFLTLLKQAQFIIGNSSAGIREAPYYGIPTINIGTRQENRSVQSDIINVDYSQKSIQHALERKVNKKPSNDSPEFGSGRSSELFLKSSMISFLGIKQTSISSKITSKRSVLKYLFFTNIDKTINKIW